MLSFREKSLWVSILVCLIIASVYGAEVFTMLVSGAETEASRVVDLINGIVIYIVILEIVLHIALAMYDQQGANAKEDEREHNYRLHANNAGYWVLSVGVILCIMQQMVITQFNLDGRSAYQGFVLAPIELKLVVVFWLAEIVRFANELYLFRKED